MSKFVPIINVTRVYVITQNGRPYRAFSDYDFAWDEYNRLVKEFPQFDWGYPVGMMICPTIARIQSGA